MTRSEPGLPVPTLVTEMRSRALERCTAAPWYSRWYWRREVRKWDSFIWRWEGGRYV